MIPKAPFARLVKEIIDEFKPIGEAGFRIQASAMNALQEAAESTLVTEFECKLFIFILVFILIYISSDQSCSNPCQACYNSTKGYDLGSANETRYARL